VVQLCQTATLKPILLTGQNFERKKPFRPTSIRRVSGKCGHSLKMGTRVSVGPKFAAARRGFLADAPDRLHRGNGQAVEPGGERAHAVALEQICRRDVPPQRVGTWPRALRQLLYELPLVAPRQGPVTLQLRSNESEPGADRLGPGVVPSQSGEQLGFPVPCRASSLPVPAGKSSWNKSSWNESSWNESSWRASSWKLAAAAKGETAVRRPNTSGDGGKPFLAAACVQLVCKSVGIAARKLVGGRGIEPLTPSMSRKCSSAELTARLRPACSCALAAGSRPLAV
jgi:hypothetical protein